MSWWILFALGVMLVLVGMLIAWLSRFVDNLAAEDLMVSAGVVMIIIGVVVIACTMVLWIITGIIASAKA